MDGIWISREQLVKLKENNDEVIKNLEEMEFFIMVAEEETKAIQESLLQADAMIESLMQENGKLVRQVEELDLQIRKGCACQRVWE